MSISTIVARGFGSFGGGVALVPTRGYAIGETAAGGHGGNVHGGGVRFTHNKPKRTELPKPRVYVPIRAVVSDRIPLPRIALRAGSFQFRIAPLKFVFHDRIPLPHFELKATMTKRIAPTWIAEEFATMRKELSQLRDEQEVSEVLNVLRATGFIGG